MAIGKQAVISLILQYIGGQMLMRMPTTVIAGSPVACEAGLGGLGSQLLGEIQALQDAIIAGDITGALSIISENPIGTFVEDLKSDISSLASGDFTALESLLPEELTSNPLFADSMNILKDSIGGGDGLSGANLALTALQEHTDRLSGTTASSDEDTTAADGGG